MKIIEFIYNLIREQLPKTVETRVRSCSLDLQLDKIGLVELLAIPET